MCHIAICRFPHIAQGIVFKSSLLFRVFSTEAINFFQRISYFNQVCGMNQPCNHFVQDIHYKDNNTLNSTLWFLILLILFFFRISYYINTYFNTGITNINVGTCNQFFNIFSSSTAKTTAKYFFILLRSHFF